MFTQHFARPRPVLIRELPSTGLVEYLEQGCEEIDFKNTGVFQPSEDTARHS